MYCHILQHEYSNADIHHMILDNDCFLFAYLSHTVTIRYGSELPVSLNMFCSRKCKANSIAMHCE